MSRFFVYKLTVDNGGAPCVTEDLLTLAICKPSVRSAAELGDWIFGFGDNKMDNRIIYVAKVTGKLVNGAYYGAMTFWSRPDCIYRWTERGALKPKSRPRFHGSADDARKDVGTHPNYTRANVLLSTDFRYFGGTDCNVEIPDEITEFVRHITRGHRRGKGSLHELQEKIWRVYRDKMVLGSPTHPRSPTKCHGGQCETF